MQKSELTYLVDDDSIYVFMARRALEKTGLAGKIEVYTDGKAAFDALRLRIEQGLAQPDVIFLDLNMPIWDGWDFLDEIQKLPVRLSSRIFIVSSSNYPEDLKRAEDYVNLSGFLNKPVPEEQIRSILLGDSSQHRKTVSQ